MKMVEDFVRVTYPEGGTKVYIVGVLGHDMQES